MAPAKVREADASAKFAIPRASRQDGPGTRSNFSDDVGNGRGARTAQEPFDVGRDGYPPGAPGFILQCEPGNFYGVVQRNELNEVSRNAVGSMGEPTVALTMIGRVGSVFEANWQSRRSPYFARALIAQINRFARGIDDMVVGPRRNLIFVAVARPSKTCA